MSLLADGRVKVSIDTDGMSDQQADKLIDQVTGFAEAEIERMLSMVRTALNATIQKRFAKQGAEDWLVVEIETEE